MFARVLGDRPKDVREHAVEVVNLSVQAFPPLARNTKQLEAQRLRVYESQCNQNNERLTIRTLLLSRVPQGGRRILYILYTK